MKLDRSSRIWTVIAAGMAMLPLLLLLKPSYQLLVLGCFALGAGSALSERMLPQWLRLVLTGSVVLLVLWLFGIGTGTRTFGRDAGSLLLVCMLGLKLLELGSLRDARSVVSFALFALMSAFLSDQGPITLLAALLAAGCVLAALARLAEAESETQPVGPLGSDLKLRAVTIGRMAAYSIPLALVGFFLFPRLATPLWGLPANSNEARTGLSESMSPGDFASLSTDDTPVLRVSFPAGIPAANQLYFRGPVLADFDGRTWNRSYWSRGEAAELGEGGRTIEHEVVQEPTDRRYLLALDVPNTVPDGAFLNRDRSLMVRLPQSKLVRNRFVSRQDVSFEAELAEPLRRAHLELPAGFNPRTGALIASWVAEDPRPEALIERALRLFNAEFTYTLDPGLLGRNSIDDFLFDTRRGFCEHFSAAFVVMMREAGVPARVVTGYLGGIPNPIGNYLIVRQSDAHAWTEVWLQGRGWVRIDPTSAVSPLRIESGADALSERGTFSRWMRPLLNVADWMRRGWNDYLLGFNATRQKDLLKPLGLEDADWRDLGIALAVAAGLALALTLYLLLRPTPDRRDPVERAFARFTARLARAGTVRLLHEPPQVFAERAAIAHPEVGAQIADLCARYHRWGYAPGGLNADAHTRLVAELLQFRVPPRSE